MRLAFHFVVGDKACYAARAVGISKVTVIDFYSFLREVQYLVQDYDFVPIGWGGGVDDVIEVDETHLFTAKYGRGRVPALRQAFWVFGCISRLTKERWFEPIPKNQEWFWIELFDDWLPQIRS